MSSATTTPIINCAGCNTPISSGVFHIPSVYCTTACYNSFIAAAATAAAAAAAAPAAPVITRQNCKCCNNIYDSNFYKHVIFDGDWFCDISCANRFQNIKQSSYMTTAYSPANILSALASQSGMYTMYPTHVNSHKGVLYF